jgi:hypothetical protein
MHREGTMHHNAGLGVVSVVVVIPQSSSPSSSRRFVLSLSRRPVSHAHCLVAALADEGVGVLLTRSCHLSVVVAVGILTVGFVVVSP